MSDLKIRYLTGDLFEQMPGIMSHLDNPTHGVIFHVCNDIGGWGSGFVVPLGKMFPKAREEYRKWADNNYYLSGDGFDRAYAGLLTTVVFEGGNFQLVNVKSNESSGGKISVCNAIGQHKTGLDNGRSPVRYSWLAKAMSKLGRSFGAMNAIGTTGDEGATTIDIHAPLFGAGLAGGDWDIIETLIQECWIDNGVPVTIYQRPGEELRPSENNPVV